MKDQILVLVLCWKPHKRSAQLLTLLLYAQVSPHAPRRGAKVTHCKPCECFPPRQRKLVRITRSPLQTGNVVIPEPPCLVFKMKLFEKATSLVKTEKPTSSQALKPLGRVGGLGSQILSKFCFGFSTLIYCVPFKK